MAEQEVNTTGLDIVKSGESVVRIGLLRTADGLRVNVQAHPAVEAFFRQNSEGTVDTRTLTRNWRHRLSTPEKPVPLMAHQRKNAIEALVIPGTGDVVNVERLGHQLLEPSQNSLGMRASNVNLSFLRLVGVSEGEGVSFVVRGVYSTEAVREMKEKLALATRTFYTAYLKPIEMSVLCVTQEVELPGITQITR